MKEKVFMLFMMLWSMTLSAQDILIMNTGKEIRGKVVEISEQSISYKVYENLNGPTYSAPLNEVFVIIYKNGVREFFSTKEATASEKNKDGKITSTPLAVLNNKNFEVRLVSKEHVPDKKNKWITVKAEVEVYRGDHLFAQLTLNAGQNKTAQLDYARINGRYFNNSSISFRSAKLSGLLFERYENFNGKGYGWALPPDFFKSDTQYCSVAFLSQKGFQKEQNLGGGIKEVIKIELQNCSSIEYKFLSVALAWLEINFIK